jgi:hypothetical protein
VSLRQDVATEAGRPPESVRRVGPALLLRASGASASPVSAEHIGEQHACERQCTDALAGPQRSRDSGA